MLGAAWKDMTSSRGWFKRLLFLCLINCVPILGPIATNGYSLSWARELSFGKHEELPERIFRKHEIITGLKAFAISFMIGSIWGIAVIACIALVAGLLSFISFIAGIVALVVLVIVAAVLTLLFVLPAIRACEMRMAVTGALEKGLNFGIVWVLFRQAMGSLIAASVVPAIIARVIQFFVSNILGLITALVIAGSTFSLMNGYVGSTDVAINIMKALSSGYLSSLLHVASDVIFVSLFFGIVKYVIDCFLNAFGALWSYRAVGYWAARNASVWVAESDEAPQGVTTEEMLVIQQTYGDPGLSGTDQAR